MSEGEFKDKIYYDFCREMFAVDATKMQIQIIDNIAFVHIQGGSSYTCTLTPRGIKKHSWRIDLS